MASVAPIRCPLCAGRAEFVGADGAFMNYHCPDCGEDFAKPEPAHDFLFANHGSVCLLTPLSEAAQAWRDEYLPGEVPTFGGGIAIEPRYANAVLEGIINDGLTLG